MMSHDWSNPGSALQFRYDKEIIPDPEGIFPEYPAVFSIWGESRKDEGSRVADLIHFLKEDRVIEDYSQVALLLHSVRLDHSVHYIRALETKGISAFCPRARGYFDNEEVRYMVACFAVLLGYYGEGHGEVKGKGLNEMVNYVDDCLIEIGRNFSAPHPLSRCIQKLEAEIWVLQEGETLDRRLADYFYQFLAHEPLASMVKNENRARNLAIFSQLLNIFQNYYHYTIVSHRNRDFLRLHFFNFFRDYDFMPSRSAEIFFGALVHQTIEDIHRRALDKRADELTEGKVRELFDFNFRHLITRGIRPIGEVQRDNAFSQVMNYFNQNRAEMDRIIETEVDVSVEKDDYILTGKIDLLLGADDKLELLDFKSQPRPLEDDLRLDSYYKQLCIYAHILERRYGKRAERLLLYWTGEPNRDEALMKFPYRFEMVNEAGIYFDHVVEQIIKKDCNYSGVSGREKHFREVRLFCQRIDNGLQEVHAVFASRG